MKLSKELIGRNMSFLIRGIPTVDIKVQAITEEEVVGTYPDGEEIHLSTDAIVGYWQGKAVKPKKVMSAEHKQKMKEARERKAKGE